ncbi:MAG: L7Ae/L30e/S12e/Gadd45 family ribosomal protein [Filifactoraceae bacterium]
MKEKISTLLGFAKKSGNLSLGEGITLEQIKRKKAKIVFLASDAGPNTAKKIKDKTAFYQIPLSTIFTRNELGKIFGVDEKVVLAVTDNGFAKRMKEILGGDDSGYYQNIPVSEGAENKQQRVIAKVVRNRSKS